MLNRFLVLSLVLVASSIGFLSNKASEAQAQSASQIIFTNCPIPGQCPMNPDINMMNPDGSGLMTATNGSAPELSPNGTQIVYTKASVAPSCIAAFPGANIRVDIYTKNIDGSSDQNITSGLPCGKYFLPRWSPDGTKIVYAYQILLGGSGGQQGLYMMNADGTNSTLVTPNGFVASWSPDGTKLVYPEASSRQFHVINVDGTGDINLGLQNGGSSSATSARWSSTGKLAFIGHNNIGCSSACIVTSDSDGSGQNIVYTAPVGSQIQDVAWSPDSSEIGTCMFLSDSGGTSGVYTLNAAGGAANLVYMAGSGCMDVSWGVVSRGVAASITSAATLTTGMRVPLDFQITTIGSPTPSLSVSGALPNGITFTDNADGTASLAGMAAVGSAGTYPLSISADNGVGSIATQSFLLTVTTAISTPAFTSENTDTETFGVPFTFSVETSGYPVPALTKNDNLPKGVNFVDNGDGTATISGTPAVKAVGVYTLTLKAKSSAGTTTQSFTLVISKSPVIKRIPNKAARVGKAFSMTVKASGYATPSLSVSGLLPAGLSFVDNGDGSAQISGTPAAGTRGTYPVTVTATNDLGSSNDTFTLRVR